MIRFEASVRIVHFDWALMPIFVNVSMWSHLKRQDLCVCGVTDNISNPAEPGARSITVSIALESQGTADAERLFDYLRKHMPLDYDVTLDGAHVDISWTPPAARLAGLFKRSTP